MTPRLVITTGEPAGVGPELTLKVLARDWPAQVAIVGDADMLAERAERLHLPVALQRYETVAEALAANPTHQGGRVAVVHTPLKRQSEPGCLLPENASYVLETLRIAHEAALHEEADAMVTAPVHKGVINEAGITFTGHTEWLAKACDTKVLMLLACPALRVALVTTHIPLREVAEQITQRRLSECIDLLCQGLVSDFGLQQPKVKVLALNPHAGEGGHLGHEEQTVIGPVVSAMQKRWPKLSGPHSADTAFVTTSGDQPDAYLGMYHDQVLSVLKYAGFGRSANITLGLPYVRTSVDHGTALDISGRGIADESSLAYAMTCAMDVIRHRRRNGHDTTD